MAESARVIPVGGEGAPAPGEDLPARLRAMDPTAWEEAVARFETPLYRFFLYSHGDHDLAQDQVGETLANLVPAVHKMRGDAGCLRAFVFGVARNVLRRGWRRRREWPAPEETLAWLADGAPSARRVAADREALERALTAIAAFQEPVRQVLLLRFVEELSLEEIAAALDLPIGTIKSHIHRARRRLRSALGQE